MNGNVGKLLCLLMLPLALLAQALPASAAGGEAGDWELGVFGGYGFLDRYQGTRPDDDVLFGVRAGYFLTPRWSLEGSYQMLSTNTNFTAPPPNVDFDIDSIRFNGLYNFRPGQSVRPFLTAGVGNETTEIGAVDDNDFGVILGGGVRWFLGDVFGLRGDLRWVNTDVGPPVNDSETNVEVTVGALWAFGGAAPVDSDGDGVNDRRDKCPGTPRGVTVDSRGCSKDSDGDGVMDGDDRCPDTPLGVSVDTRGCPLDSDRDGVDDATDECPDTPRRAKVDAVGCPLDSDRDGVYDGLDRCPGTPLGAIVDATGCPMDSDGDGVYDGIDRCPGTPAGTKVDAKGCRILFESGKDTVILRGVNFHFDSADLTMESKAILDSVARAMKQHPRIRVEVAGHTDSLGDDGYNLNLSTRRANRVRDYLIGKGVDGSRMQAAGYGEQRPISENTTKDGRWLNRRVELNRLD